MRPPRLVTRTISFATSNGLGANIAPKMLTTRSKVLSGSSSRLEASPSWNFKLVRPCSFARRLPASTRLVAMSTPRTSAPSFASGNAVVPSPHPSSSTFIPGLTPIRCTNASPLSRMVAAMRVKSPFSQSSLFGFIGAVKVVIPFKAESACEIHHRNADAAARRPYREEVALVHLVSVVLPLRNQPNPACQVGEAWIRAKIIEPWLGRECHQSGRPLFITLFEPRERLIVFAEPGMDHGEFE